MGGITDIPEHLPVFLLGTEKGKKAKRKKGKKIKRKTIKTKKYKRTKKSPTRQIKDKITHTWQGVQRVPTPSAGARTRGP